MDPEKIKAIVDWAEPHIVNDARVFTSDEK